MNDRLGIRINASEKAILNKLAKSYDLSVSDYVKLKIFEHNIDYVGQESKFVIPQELKHSYFLALSQIKLYLTLQELFERQGLMDREEFKSFDKKITEIGKEIIGKFGYKKIVVTEDE